MLLTVPASIKDSNWRITARGRANDCHGHRKPICRNRSKEAWSQNLPLRPSMRSLNKATLVFGVLCKKVGKVTKYPNICRSPSNVYPSCLYLHQSLHLKVSGGWMELDVWWKAHQHSARAQNPKQELVFKIVWIQDWSFVRQLRCLCLNVSAALGMSHTNKLQLRSHNSIF